MSKEEYIAVGRRKASVARVRMVPGTGQFSVNKKDLLNYFKRETLKMLIEKPFEHIEQVGNFDIVARVNGGGLSGQAGALQLGISRCLAKVDDEFQVKLRKEDFLTRDARVVERKKYGQKGARKRFQFSKR